MYVAVFPHTHTHTVMSIASLNKPNSMFFIKVSINYNTGTISCRVIRPSVKKLQERQAGSFAVAEMSLSKFSIVFFFCICHCNINLVLHVNQIFSIFCYSSILLNPSVGGRRIQSEISNTDIFRFNHFQNVCP